MSDEGFGMKDGQHLKKKDFMHVVSFQLNQEEYAIEITKVKEIILLEGITHIPQVPDFIEGIINLRGNVIPIIDLRMRFGLPAVERGEHARVMVTRMEGKIIGLIVDSVSQVMKIPKTNVQPPPETIASIAGEYILGIGRMDNRMIILLDIEKILITSEKQSLKIGEEREVAMVA